MDLEVLDNENAWQRNTRVASELMRWLEQNCRYSTDLGDFIQIVGEDPTVSFPETYRFGHCEYFASALTAMCQSLGIESRLTGFIAMEYDERTSTYVVRESNAHAVRGPQRGLPVEVLRSSPDNQLMEIQARTSPGRQLAGSTIVSTSSGTPPWSDSTPVPRSCSRRGPPGAGMSRCGGS